MGNVEDGANTSQQKRGQTLSRSADSSTFEIRALESTDSLRTEIPRSGRRGAFTVWWGKKVALNSLSARSSSVAAACTLHAMCVGCGDSDVIFGRPTSMPENDV